MGLCGSHGERAGVLFGYFWAVPFSACFSAAGGDAGEARAEQHLADGRSGCRAAHWAAVLRSSSTSCVLRLASPAL